MLKCRAEIRLMTCQMALFIFSFQTYTDRHIHTYLHYTHRYINSSAPSLSTHLYGCIMHHVDSCVCVCCVVCVVLFGGVCDSFVDVFFLSFGLGNPISSFLVSKFSTHMAWLACLACLGMHVLVLCLHGVINHEAMVYTHTLTHTHTHTRTCAHDQNGSLLLLQDTHMYVPCALNARQQNAKPTMYLACLKGGTSECNYSK